MKDSKNLDKLAREVTKLMTNNNYLLKIIEIYNHYSNLIKEIISKESEQEIPSLKYFKLYSKQIEKEYNNIKENYKNACTKYNSLLDECGSEISIGKPVLSQKKNEEFTLNFLKNEKEDTINWIKKCIKASKKFHLFREHKRDNLVDIAKGNMKMEKITNEFQQDMLTDSKKCNKYNNKIRKYELKIVGIKNNIEILNKYIEKNKYKVTNFKDYSKEKIKSDIQNSKVIKIPNKKKLIRSELTKNNFREKRNSPFNNENNSDIDFGNKTQNNKKNLISGFIKVENLFDISNEEGENENAIDYELHSDDETVFENKIKIPNQLSTKYIKEINKQIPKFNFKQIEFNKNKVNEIDVYSLQRRQFKNKNVDVKIIEMKKKIDQINNKIDILKHKEIIMREFVKKLEQNYEMMKSLVHQTTQVDIVQNDLIFDELNSEQKKERDEINEFLDNIEEVEEEVEYNENYEVKKADNDKKEIKPKNKKEYEEEKNLEEKILKSVLKKSLLKTKNLALKKTVKKPRKNILVSLPIKFLRKNVEKKKERARSK